MKKVLLSSLAVFAFVLGTSAQNYYAVKGSNYAPAGYDFSKTFDAGVTTLLNKTSNDLMSTEQTIPFTFNFYGTPYTKYKASDNGYLSFNTNSTTSKAPSLSPLPTAPGPNNAIYAFWHDFELKAAPNPNFVVKVISYTTGTAPNRVHHIQWFGVSRQGAAIAGNSDVYSFAVSLHEGTEGNFDLTYNAYGSTAPAGIIGCENSDGTVAKMLGDAVTTFKNATGASGDIVYRFIYGTQSALDAATIGTNVEGFYKTGSTVDIEATVTNFGTTAITSLDLNYTIGAGATQTTSLTGLDIKANGENAVTVKSDKPWTVGAAGTIADVRVWVSNPNAGTDGNLANNETTRANVISINGTSTQRNLLFEEATGAWCQHCPDADVYMANLRSTHVDRIIIARHHNSDLMTNTQSDMLNSAYAAGYPSAFFDRTKQTGQNTVGISRGLWNQVANNSLSVSTPAKINVTNVVYNNTTRKLDFTIEAEFVDYYGGNLRIGAMIKEDEIRGVGTGYDQIISGVYTGNPNHIFSGKKNPMVGYPHEDVIVAIPSGAWGSPGSVPITVAPAQKVTFNYSYTLPAMTTANIPTTAEFFPHGVQASRNKPANIWIIGFIAEYDDKDDTKRRILNANERQMWNTAAGVTTNDIAANTFTLVPNTANNHVEIALNYNNPTANNAQVTITNLAGQTIGTYNMNDLKTGMNTMKINTTDFANGMYLVNITGTKMNLTQKLVIAH